MSGVIRRSKLSWLSGCHSDLKSSHLLEEKTAECIQTPVRGESKSEVYRSINEEQQVLLELFHCPAAPE